MNTGLPVIARPVSGLLPEARDLAAAVVAALDIPFPWPATAEALSQFHAVMLCRTSAVREELDLAADERCALTYATVARRVREVADLYPALYDLSDEEDDR